MTLPSRRPRYAYCLALAALLGSAAAMSPAAAQVDMQDRPVLTITSERMPQSSFGQYGQAGMNAGNAQSAGQPAGMSMESQNTMGGYGMESSTGTGAGYAGGGYGQPSMDSMGGGAYGSQPQSLSAGQLAGGMDGSASWSAPAQGGGMQAGQSSYGGYQSGYNMSGGASGYGQQQPQQPQPQQQWQQPAPAYAGAMGGQTMAPQGMSQNTDQGMTMQADPGTSFAQARGTSNYWQRNSYTYSPRPDAARFQGRTQEVSRRISLSEAPAAQQQQQQQAGTGFGYGMESGNTGMGMNASGYGMAASPAPSVQSMPLESAAGYDSAPAITWNQPQTGQMTGQMGGQMDNQAGGLYGQTAPSPAPANYDAPYGSAAYGNSSYGGGAYGTAPASPVYAPSGAQPVPRGPAATYNTQPAMGAANTATTGGTVDAEELNRQQAAIAAQSGAMYGGAGMGTPSMSGSAYRNDSAAAAMPVYQPQTAPYTGGAVGTAPAAPAPSPAAAAPATSPSGRQLAEIDFTSGNVDYAGPVSAAVADALSRYPNARLSLIATYPAGGNAAMMAIESTRARRNAEQVLRTLADRGIDTGRIDVGTMASSDTTGAAVRIFVL